MRRHFFALGLILVLITSAGVALSTAHAQSPGPAGPAKPNDNDNVGSAISDAMKAQSTEENKDVSARTPVSFTNKDMASTYGSLMAWIMELFAWLLGVAMLTLDYAVYYTVVTMGNYIHNLTAVGVAWRILRDIGNIALIFGFLAVGITVILNVGWYGNGKKFLPGLLIAAVFLNFSLFMTEAVIDAGNLFATQFYTQINGGSLPKQNPAGLLTTASGAALTAKNEGVSQKIMAQLGFQTMYNEGRVHTKVFEGSSPFLIGFMGILLFITTAFVMFSLAFILIARFIALVFLIILSPIGFAGLAVPQLKQSADKWWSTLFEQTITAPILLLLLYIALAVITDAQFLTGFGIKNGLTWVGWVDNMNLPGFASMMLSFLVAMGLLLSVTYFSKKLGAFGGAWATKTAGGLSFGATAWAGRTSGGWLARKGANFARSTAIGRVPLLGTGLVRGLDKVAGASFDFRGTGALKNFPGGGIDAGTAQKGGYNADLKSRIESRTKYASELKGRELTEDEKLQQQAIQAEVVAERKRLGRLVAQRRTATGAAAAALDTQIEASKKKISDNETDLSKLESVTDKGAQRKYATVLELGLKKGGIFNTYLNFAANTEAAKKIRAEAKKSSDDKTLDAIKKAVANSAAGGGGGGTTPPPSATPTGGTGPGGAAGPGGSTAGTP